MGICISKNKKTYPAKPSTRINEYIVETDNFPFLNNLFSCVIDPEVKSSKKNNFPPSESISNTPFDSLSATTPLERDNLDEPNISTEDPNRLWYIGFIPKSINVSFIVGKLSHQDNWNRYEMPWSECYKFAKFILKSKFNMTQDSQYSNEANKVIIDESNEYSHTIDDTKIWDIFQEELEKCFWRGDLSFNSSSRILTCRFIEMNVHMDIGPLQITNRFEDKAELFQYLMVSYKGMWDSKIAEDRRNAIATQFEEEQSHGDYSITSGNLTKNLNQSKEATITSASLDSKNLSKIHSNNSKTKAASVQSSSTPNLRRKQRGKSFLTVKGLKRVVHIEQSDSDEEDNVVVECSSPLGSLHSTVLSKKIENSQIEEEIISSADENFASNLPINKVIRYLAHIRRKSPSVRDKIDYILNVIVNDSLFEVNVEELAKEEEDLETRTWIKSEFRMENVPFKDKPISKFKAYVYLIMFALSLQNSSRIKKLKDVKETITFSKEIEDCLVNLDSVLSFDILELDYVSNHQSLYFIGLALFRRYRLISRFDISVASLKHFLVTLQEGYLKNPYHNSLHAADVTQTLHALMQSGNIVSSFADLDILSAILAALIHDFRHSGRTNAFEMKISTERALLYNDQSILEMYHLTEAFRILSKDKCNILKNLQPHEYRYVRNMVVSLVLSTDITHHFTIISQAQSTIVKRFDKSKIEDVTLLLRLLLKCADVSNPTKKRHLAEYWANQVMEEFYLQGDDERKLGLPISPFMDREKPAKEKCQCGFISYICKPLFDCLQKFERSCSIYFAQLNNNEREWQRLSKEHDLKDAQKEEVENNYVKTHNLNKPKEELEDSNESKPNEENQSSDTNTDTKLNQNITNQSSDTNTETKQNIISGQQNQKSKSTTSSNSNPVNSNRQIKSSTKNSPSAIVPTKRSTSNKNLSQIQGNPPSPNSTQSSSPQKAANPNLKVSPVSTKKRLQADSPPLVPIIPPPTTKSKMKKTKFI